jgi:phospholipid/cholesterol/gamma-HCH transport system substrate-binding protein
MGPRVLGVLFLALCLLFVWFTYAMFNKSFASYDEVTLQSSKIGLSMPARADVKIRGVIVGEVLETTTTGDGAELTLGLYPDRSANIPADVSAQILPKTLFGEKYVALQVPEGGGSGTIDAGDTIEQAEMSVELEAVINDLFPLLRTVQPVELNYTLTAMANALEGRGDAIGGSLETLDSYLRKMNPEFPALLESLRQLGETAEVYESIVPDLTQMLRNSVTTGETFQSKEDQIEAMFNDVAGFAATSEEFLEANGDNMVALADQGQRILPILAKHSPMFECFLAGAVASIGPNEEAFRDKTLHIILETLPRQPRGYTPADRPAFDDKRGAFPYCEDLYKGIRGEYGQDNLIPPRLIPRIRDGVQYPIAKRTAVNDRVIGTREHREVLDLASAAVLDIPVEEVPALAALLLGPMAQGKAVDVR